MFTHCCGQSFDRSTKKGSENPILAAEAPEINFRVNCEKVWY